MTRGDESRRAAERSAALGDPQAAAQAERDRARADRPTAADLARACDELAGRLNRAPECSDRREGRCISHILCPTCGTEPHSAVAVARTLSATMRAHVTHGIGGATDRTLAALERRGLIADAPERPGCVKLSPLGEAVRAVLLGERGGAA